MHDVISVAIATYNGEKFLRKQLNSLYNQTLLPNEIVVVDDCSTDNTVLILEEFRQKKGLVYHVNEKSLGVNKNFEKAITLCTGNYIAICDQDDIWLPEKIQISYDKMKEIEKENEPTLITSQCIHIDANDHILYRPKIKKDENSYTSTLFGHNSQGCSFLMNKPLVNMVIPFPQYEKNMYDIYIGLTAAMTGNKYDLGKSLMKYRHHSFNVSGRNASFSIKDRVLNLSNKFYPFFSEGRFNNMLYVSERFSGYFKPERKELYNQIMEISSETKLFKKIYKVIKINELCLGLKIVIICNITINKLKK